MASDIQSSSESISLLDQDGGAVRENFGGSLSNRGCRKAHVDHGVCAKLGRLRDHAARRLGAALLKKLGIAPELAADDVLEAGRKVPPKVLRSNRAPLDQSEVLDDLPARHAFDVGENQMSPSMCEG